MKLPVVLSLLMTCAITISDCPRSFAAEHDRSVRDCIVPLQPEELRVLRQKLHKAKHDHAVLSAKMSGFLEAADAKLPFYTRPGDMLALFALKSDYSIQLKVSEIETAKRDGHNLLVAQLQLAGYDYSGRSTPELVANIIRLKQRLYDPMIEQHERSNTVIEWMETTYRAQVAAIRKRLRS